jgi:glycosyltransferase involved in cell wall biosynthesis
MRLLLYCDDPGYGGTAVNAGLLAAGLAAQGHDVALAASADITGNAPGLAFIPIDFDTMRTFAKTALSRVEPEAALLAAKPELVLFCDGAPDSSLAAKAVCRDWGIPYLVHVNYVAPSHPAQLGPRLAAVCRANAAALAVVAVSGENLALLRLAFGAPSGRSGVIHYGRPMAFFEPVAAAERLARRNALGLADDDVLCLTVARYEPRKGYRHLLAALRLLAGHPAGERLRFAAIGHSLGDGLRQMERTVAACGASGKLRLLGQRDDVREWLGAADIFVLPSESEGMPLCIMEAMGQGLPVVASAVSGIPEQLGDAGILLSDPNIFPEATARELAHALAGLAADPAARSRLGQAARRRALERFTLPAMLRVWAGLLDSLAPAVAAASPCWPDPATYLPPNTVPLGTDIPLGEDRDVAPFLKEGWSHGEPDGRWSEGTMARLRLGLPEAARDGFVLEIAGRPYRGGDAPLAMTVAVAGREVGRFAWPGAANPLRTAVCCLPDGQRLAQQTDICFTLTGASSPASHGESDDTRLLGFFLAHLRLSPLARP